MTFEFVAALIFAMVMATVIVLIVSGEKPDWW